MPGTDTPNHYVTIDERLCNGCVLCMKACPTKAIRVKEGRTASIQGVCIYCGECVRVCPRNAVKAVTSGEDVQSLTRNATIIVSPVIYTQYGDEVMPNEILLAVHSSFTYVYDLGYTNELYNLATEMYIQKNHTKKGAPWPLISPACPVINRIISYRFPSLLKNLLPIITPRELAAKFLRERLPSRGRIPDREPLPSEGRLPSEEVSRTDPKVIYSLTPCPAEIISIREPILLNDSFLDGVLGINELYGIVNRNIRKGEEHILLHRSGGIGMGWGFSGGEISGLNTGKYLAVSGIQESIRYLEKIEMGLFNGLDYVELRACSEGCVGGPMTVADRYQAKRTIQKLVRMFGIEKRTRYSEIQKAYEEGWFFSDIKRVLGADCEKPLTFSEALQKQEQIGKILEMLPGKECGVCGSPDCQTFAEDVVEGRTTLEHCVFLK